MYRICCTYVFLVCCFLCLLWLSTKYFVFSSLKDFLIILFSSWYRPYNEPDFFGVKIFLLRCILRIFQNIESPNLFLYWLWNGPWFTPFCYTCRTEFLEMLMLQFSLDCHIHVTLNCHQPLVTFQLPWWVSTLLCGAFFQKQWQPRVVPYQRMKHYILLES